MEQQRMEKERDRIDAVKKDLKEKKKKYKEAKVKSKSKGRKKK